MNDIGYDVATRALSRWPQVVAYVWSDEAKVLSAGEVVEEIKRRWPEAHVEFMKAFGLKDDKE